MPKIKVSMQQLVRDKKDTHSFSILGHCTVLVADKEGVMSKYQKLQDLGNLVDFVIMDSLLLLQSHLIWARFNKAIKDSCT